VTDPGIESVTWTEAAALGRNGEEAEVELHGGAQPEIPRRCGWRFFFFVWDVWLDIG